MKFLGNLKSTHAFVPVSIVSTVLANVNKLETCVDT